MPFNGNTYTLPDGSLVQNGQVTNESQHNVPLLDIGVSLTALSTALDTKVPAADFSVFANRTDNPHGVTAAQVGLGSVNNTSDEDKPVSTPQQAALDGKIDLGLRPQRLDVAFIQDLQPDTNPDSPLVGGGNEDQVLEARNLLAGVSQHHPEVVRVYMAEEVDRGVVEREEAEANVNPPYLLGDAAEDIYSLLGLPTDHASANHPRDYKSEVDRERYDPHWHWKQYFQKTTYYQIWGNFIIIVLGDMGNDTSGYISEFAFEWYKRVRENHEGQTPIVVSHQLLHDTGLGTSSDPTDAAFIQNSQRFIDHLAEYPVPLWVSGHELVNSASDPTHMHSVAHNGCLFVNSGVHVPSALEGNPSDMTYPILRLVNGSNQATIQRWDHVAEAFVPAGEVTFTLPYTALLSAVMDYNGRHAVSQYDALEGERVSFQSIDKLTGPGSEVQQTDYFAHSHIVYDNYGNNIAGGIKVHNRVAVPGGAGRDFETSYGWGAGWAAQRVTGVELDYSADFVGFASTDGRDMSSFVEAFRGHIDGSLSTPAGLRDSWVSEWVEIDSATAPTAGTDFVHDLNIADPFIAKTEVYFWSGVEGDRVYDWGKSSPVAEVLRHDGSLSFKDGNTVTVGVGNDGVFSVDNVDGGATQNFASGFFLVCISKTPNLPALPTV